MKVSIITVTYNSGKTIGDTIQSVLRQTYQNIEYIIVDGASKDNTLDIVATYIPQFNGRLKWISEKDKGIYDAMNKGIRMATGDIVGTLNSDDLFMDDSVLMDIAHAFDDTTDGVFGNLKFVKTDDTGTVVRLWRGSPYRSFTKGWHPAHPTFYVRKWVYEKYGLFDISFPVSADFELMLRFIEKYRIQTKYLDRYMVKMRVGGESTGSVRNIIKGNRNIMKAFRKNAIVVSPFYPIMRLFPKILDIVKFKLHIR